MEGNAVDYTAIANGITHGAAYLGAAVGLGIAGCGVGLGEGFVAGKAMESLGKIPEQSGLMTRSMLVGMAVVETCAIYSLVIALLLLFAI
ncbi:MAG: ATP synthase F0 subunit C [Candidatus Cloacimonetes bacterium]|nr:ATP synthase F0 subunit C [Candidatus Cloacimonadota bacterium]